MEPDVRAAVLKNVLEALEVEREDGVFVFVEVREALDLAPRAIVREPEGLCAVVLREEALALGLSWTFEAAWLTLTVPTELSLVGLTAAVATALANAGIACNVLAGLYHDHLLVPVERADEALACLRALRAGLAE